MASFSPSEVALTGFGVVRKNPQAVLIWSVLIAVFELCATYLMVRHFGPVLMELQAFRSTGAGANAEVMAMLTKLAPFYALLIVLMLPYMAVVGP
jgi:hypothetical protein